MVDGHGDTRWLPEKINRAVQPEDGFWTTFLAALGPSGLDLAAVRKPAGNLAVARKATRGALARKKTHPEIQDKDAPVPASFMTGSV